MIEPDLEQRRQRGICRDMAADSSVIFILVDHHRHGVPADDTLDPPLHRTIARVGDFGLGRYGVYVRCVEMHRQLGAGRRGPLIELLQQVRNAVRPRFVENLVQRLQPFPGFLGIEIHNPLCYVLMHGYLYYN